MFRNEARRVDVSILLVSFWLQRIALEDVIRADLRRCEGTPLPSGLL